MTAEAKGSAPPADVARMKPTALYASSQCAQKQTSPEMSSQWINSQTQLDEAYSFLHSYLVDSKRPAAPKLDFYTTGALLVYMGRKTTGGYSLLLPEQELSIHDGTAVLRLKWVEPPADRKLVQVMSNPCLLVLMPLSDYRRIEVIDQNNTKRTSLTF